MTARSKLSRSAWIDQQKQLNQTKSLPLIPISKNCFVPFRIQVVILYILGRLFRASSISRKCEGGISGKTQGRVTLKTLPMHENRNRGKSK